MTELLGSKISEDVNIINIIDLMRCRIRRRVNPDENIHFVFVAAVKVEVDKLLGKCIISFISQAVRNPFALFLGTRQTSDKRRRAQCNVLARRHVTGPLWLARAAMTLSFVSRSMYNTSGDCRLMVGLTHWTGRSNEHDHV